MGSLLKQILPKGVMNIVRRREAGDSRSCQNQLFVLKLAE